MPSRPPHKCNQDGCLKLVSGAPYCPECTRQRDQSYDQIRGTSSERGYDAVWAKVRRKKLSQNPLCEEHLRQGRDVPAVLVHHIQPIDRGGERLEMSNLMSLCGACHEAIHGAGRFRPRQGQRE